MAKFKVNWLEIKTGKSGKQYMVMHLLDEQGVETQNVSTFDLTYNLGQEIEGEIVQNGNFKNWKAKLEAPQFIKQAGNSAFKNKQIEEAQNRTSNFVAKAQDNKEWGIKTSSTMNKAIDLAIAEGKPEPITILKWREWIWNNWDVEDDQYPPFN